jgi:hypothetical protein
VYHLFGCVLCVVLSGKQESGWEAEKGRGKEEGESGVNEGVEGGGGGKGGEKEKKQRVRRGDLGNKLEYHRTGRHSLYLANATTPVCAATEVANCNTNLVSGRKERRG